MRSELMVLLLLGLPAALPAQSRAPGRGGTFAAGITVGVAAFGAAAHGVGEDGQLLAFSPYRPTMWGLRFVAGRAGARLTTTAAWGQPGLLVQGSGGTAAGLLLVAPDAYHVGALAAAFSVPALRLHEGPVVRPGVGLRLERWGTPGSSARWVVGADASAELEVALVRDLAASLEVQVGLTPASPFRREDLPPAFTPRATWRRALGLSLLWRW